LPASRKNIENKNKTGYFVFLISGLDYNASTVPDRNKTATTALAEENA